EAEVVVAVVLDESGGAEAAQPFAQPALVHAREVREVIRREAAGAGHGAEEAQSQAEGSHRGNEGAGGDARDQGLLFAQAFGVDSGVGHGSSRGEEIVIVSVAILELQSSSSPRSNR